MSYADPSANEAAKKTHAPDNVTYAETSDKEASQLILLYKPTESSVLADANVEAFLRTIRPKGTGSSAPLYKTPQSFEIVIKNRSSKTIYVDLGNTFLICDGNSNRYYVPSATSKSHSTSTGGSVNLGAVAGAMGVGGAVGQLASGVNVGGSSGNTTSTVVYSERILTIPLRGTAALPAVELPKPPEIKKSGSDYGLGVHSFFSYQRPKDKQVHMGEKSTDLNAGIFPQISTLLTYGLNEELTSPVSLEAIYQPTVMIGSKAKKIVTDRLLNLEGFSPELDECLYIWLLQQKK